MSLNLNLTMAPKSDAKSATAKPIEICSNKKYPLLLDQDSPAVETFGVLRARLLSMFEQRKISSVLITSPEKSEGKTLISTNLALSLAELKGNRVLLIDGDLRIRNVTRLFRSEAIAGLGEVLAGSVAIEDAIRETTVPGLSFLAAGNLPDERISALLQGSHWREIVAHVKPKYDAIIVDSVPANVPVADFELMSSAIEGIMVVVRLRQTNRDSLSSAAKVIPAEKMLGFVINNSVRASRYMYPYYSGNKR